MNKGIYSALNIVRKLNHIPRCFRFPLVRATSVAEHSFHTAVTALFLAEELKAGAYPALDMEKLLRRALLHDTEESLVSDIPYDVKKHLTGITEALERMFEETFVHPPEWFRVAVCGSCDGSIEHQVAKLADMLELAVYCVGEVRMGNKHLLAILREALTVSTKRNETIGSPGAARIIKECYCDAH